MPIYSTFIVPNNFIWDETIQKYKVTITASTLAEYFTSDYDSIVLKCMRVDGLNYRPVLLYWEVTETGDLTLFFDETFIARISVSTTFEA